MSEYIGSRISLISKSDIRYVGTLKAIDSDTATVSLEHVTCSGTEGRKGDPEQEIPGSDMIYDGIVFRGSDVKDLTIIAPPKENRPPQMPNDPAILQTAPAPPPGPPQQQQQSPPYQQHQQQQFAYPGPPPNQFQQPSRFQGPGGPHGFPGSPGAVPGYGGGYGGPPPPPGYGMGMGYGPPPGYGGPPGHFPPQQHMHGVMPGQQMNQQRDPPPGAQPGPHQTPLGSKQQTPQPTMPQASQAPAQLAANQAVEMDTTRASPSAPSQARPPPPLDSKPLIAAALASSAVAQTQPPATAVKATQKGSNRVAVPLPPPNQIGSKPQPKPTPNTQSQTPGATGHQSQPAATATEAATAAVAAAMAKLGTTNRQSDAMENLTQKVNQMRVQDSQWRGRGAPRGTRRGGAPPQKTVPVPKEDFDFEGANAKFNEREQIKEAIASGSPVPTPPNGAASESLAPVPNGHGGDLDDVVIPAAEKVYDKKSSFFDNISSDLKDRADQQPGETFDGRTMRREERTKNVETFGQGTADNGGYRGRGRGRGGRGYRGGSYGTRGTTNTRGRGRGDFEGTYIARGTTRGPGRGDAESAAV